MKSWGVIVCLAAIAGVQVLADDFAFPENARSLAGARIVSGWEAAEGQIPWQLSLRMVNPTGAVSSCGGSIIHPEWGLTAAHCTATRITMVLRAGAVSLWRPELIFETFEYFNHPAYIDALQTVVQPNDIAILKFQRSITFSDRVQPIRIQNSLDRNRNYEGERLIASGWGRTWTNGATPENLQWVYLSGDSNLRCWSAYGGSSIIVDSTICASYYNVTSQSTCQGDSGGPLVEEAEDGIPTLIGVTSFVSALGCHADMPAGFIRPGHYHDWITQVTGINFDWVPQEPTTTETPTTEAESSSESESSESSESSSEESEEVTTTEAATTEAATTEAATTEAATTEAATTEAPTTEADSSSESSESSSEESEEATTTEAATTEAPTTEAESSEEVATTEAATTEAPATEAASSEESEEAATTEAPTTEAASSEESEEVATTEAPATEAPSSEESEEAATTEAASSEESEEAATTEAPTTEAASSEESEEAATTEAATTEAPTTEAATTESAASEEASEEASAEASEETEEEQQSRLFWSVFRGFSGF